MHASERARDETHAQHAAAAQQAAAAQHAAAGASQWKVDSARVEGGRQGEAGRQAGREVDRQAGREGGGQAYLSSSAAGGESVRANRSKAMRSRVVTASTGDRTSAMNLPVPVGEKVRGERRERENGGTE